MHTQKDKHQFPALNLHEIFEFLITTDGLLNKKTITSRHLNYLIAPMCCCLFQKKRISLFLTREILHDQIQARKAFLFHFMMCYHFIMWFCRANPVLWLTEAMRCIYVLQILLFFSKCLRCAVWSEASRKICSCLQRDWNGSQDNSIKTLDKQAAWMMCCSVATEQKTVNEMLILICQTYEQFCVEKPDHLPINHHHCPASSMFLCQQIHAARLEALIAS